MVNEPVIYAHRGIWSSIEEQNSSSSFESAAENGFGIETDFRSFKSKLVISHDPLSKSNFLDFDMNLFSGIPVAMNIKEDGLGELYKEFLFENSSDFSFVFDGSIPEMQKIRKKGIPHALRLSEYEKELPWETNFIWVDGFETDWWIDNPRILDLKEKHFMVFVSPEIHGREFEKAWKYFRKISIETHTKYGICTDKPFELREFFNE